MMRTLTDSHSPAQAPPWLWFWLGTFLLSAPALWAEIGRILAQGNVRGSVAGPVALLNAPAVLIDVLPPAALLLGAAVALLPDARRRLVEWRYRLGPVPPGVAAADEIAAFVATHAPRLELTWNLVRGREIAMVYPAGYRRTRLAVFGGLVRLWRRDRGAAEAVLLHEVAHQRHGDALILGAGSVFTLLVRYTVIGFLVFLAVPQAIGTLIQTIQAHREMSRPAAEWQHIVDQMNGAGIPIPPGGPEYHPGELVLTHLRFFLTGIAGMLPVVLLAMLRFMVMPLAAIWTAELYADGYVLERQGSSASLERGLGTLQRPVRWWRWLLFRLSHPPVRLRQWLARDGAAREKVLILLFPAAYLVRLLVLLGWGYAASSSAQIEFLTLENTRVYFATLAPVTVCAGLLTIAWPTLACIFPSASLPRGDGLTPAVPPLRIVRANLVCGAALLAAAALSLMLRP
jgi:Zn-dependent protease with chaperone function